MYFIMKISDMCLKKNLNFKMCRNWRKTENVEWVGICAALRGKSPNRRAIKVLTWN